MSNSVKKVTKVMFWHGMLSLLIWIVYDDKDSH